MGIQVTFPFLQAIYQRITIINRFLTPPKYKNQPVLDTVRIQESASLLASHTASACLSAEIGTVSNAAGDDEAEPDMQHC